MISQIEKIGGQTRSRSDGASYGIEITCKVNHWKKIIIRFSFLFGFSESSAFLFW
jgi:hypothetical protein